MNKYCILFLKVIAAVMMLQTLFFKFSAAQESINLFTKIAQENEAYMRIGTGIIELIASILLFVPNKNWLGASLTVGVMSGAIVSHLTILGVEHNNDGGMLFYSAIVTFVAATIILFHCRKDIIIFGTHFAKS